MVKTAATLVLGIMLSTAAFAAPSTLTDQQMDAVTAGLSVAVKSIAVAVGRQVKTDTYSNVDGAAHQLFDIGWGFSKGMALAVGQTPDGRSPWAKSDSFASGEGDIVRSFRGGFQRRNRGEALATSWVVVVAIDYRDDLATLSRFQRMILDAQINREIFSLTRLARIGKL